MPRSGHRRRAAAKPAGGLGGAVSPPMGSRGEAPGNFLKITSLKRLINAFWVSPYAPYMRGVEDKLRTLGRIWTMNYEKWDRPCLTMPKHRKTRSTNLKEFGKINDCFKHFLKITTKSAHATYVYTNWPENIKLVIIHHSSHSYNGHHRPKLLHHENVNPSGMKLVCAGCFKS